jgi:hypothetical protein
MWLSNASLPEEWKPERSKIMIVMDRSRNHLLAIVDPAYPNAWKREPFHSWLRKNAANGLPHSGAVMVKVNGQVTLVLPDHDVFFGVIAADERIMLARVAGPHGPRIEATLVKASALPPDSIGKWQAVDASPRPRSV